MREVTGGEGVGNGVGQDVQLCQGSCRSDLCPADNTLNLGATRRIVGNILHLCICHFNGDSIVDFFDYLDFVDAFSAGCP